MANLIASLIPAASDVSKEQLRFDVVNASRGLFEIQKNLRILSNICWPTSVEERFHLGKGIRKEVKSFYSARGLSFDAETKSEEIERVKGQIRYRLGGSPLEPVLLGRLDDYHSVAHLLEARGTPEFNTWSRKLWGSSQDKLFSDGTTVLQYAQTLRRIIKSLVTPEQRHEDEKVIPAQAAVELMKVRFRESHLMEYIDVVLSDKIVANAAAAVGKIKLRRDAMFSVKDLEVLIYHEAFTHIATGLNGRAQPFAKFLGFDSPRCTSTQEGLAVLMEIFSNTTYPQRILKIADRVIAVGNAENGADPKQVHDDLCQKGYSEHEAYQLMARVFRGTDLRAGSAFTKDVSYLKGLIECFNFIQFCLVKNRAKLIPFLFAGKLNIDEMPALARAATEHLVQKPKWVPSQFQDLGALSSWFICTAALGQLSDSGYHEQWEKQLQI